MTPQKIVGIVLIVVGVGLAYTGYEMSQELTNQLSEAFSGSPTDNVTLRYLLGAGAFAGGVYLLK